MLFYELKRQAESHASCHHRKGQEHARHEILPLEGQDLIDTQTGKVQRAHISTQMTSSVLPANQTKPGI